MTSSSSLSISDEPNCCFCVRNRRWRIPIYWGFPIDKLRLSLAEAELDKRYGTNCKRTPASYEYNCHGLTFSHRIGWIGVGRHNPSQSAWIVEGIETPQHADHIGLILENCGYRRVARLDNVAIDNFKPSHDIKIGDVVIYKLISNGREEITHSGLVIEIDKARLLLGATTAPTSSIRSVEVLSKFGNGPEYIHSALNVPNEYGNVIEIWTDRPLD